MSITKNHESHYVTVLDHPPEKMSLVLEFSPKILYEP